MAASRGGSAELNILVARPDRMGDVILSTPVLDVLKLHYPQAKITYLVRAFVKPIVEGLSSVDQVLVYDPEGIHRGMDGLFALIRTIREQKIKIGVVLHSDWKIAAALYGAGVPYRVGPLSKPHSFFFYNRGIRQRRSEIEMHEADYNMQLLRRLGIRVGSHLVPPRVAASGSAGEQGRAWLLAQGYNPQERLIVVHSGMGGSALNWPDTHYAELVRALLREGRQVLLTAGPTEAQQVQKIVEAIGPNLRKPMVFVAGAQDGIDLLAGLFVWSDLVIAPSTGPLHLAVALGKPVVTFYPPVKVQSALRWGPYTRDDSKATVLVPDVYCGQEFKCKGSECHYYFCMRSVPVKAALAAVHTHLARMEAK